MPKAKNSNRKSSASTELPFAPLAFSTAAKSIPIGEPDTASLTAMPELTAPIVIPTNNDWRQNPRWKPLIGTPSKDPIPAGTLVPDPSPAKTWSDTASDVLVPPSPAGSFVHRRRRGEYAERPPVWSIQALVEDTKGWHEMGDINRAFFHPWTGKLSGETVSYANQLEKMAGVMTQEPLIVGIAMTSFPPEVPEKDPRRASSGTHAGKSDLTPLLERISSEEPTASPSNVPAIQAVQGEASNHNPSVDTTAATAVDHTVFPWLAAVEAIPDNEETQNSIKRELLKSYRDIRSEAGLQIVPGSLVVCVAATSWVEETEFDQFKLSFGGLYRVLQIFGDTWAFCQKLSAEEKGPDLSTKSRIDNGPKSRRRNMGTGVRKYVDFALIAPSDTLSFLPLCAVTHWNNFEAYCMRARIGPDYSRNSSDAYNSAAGSIRINGPAPGTETGIQWVHKDPASGGIVKAAPRFSSYPMGSNEYRTEAGVLVTKDVYNEYIRPAGIWRVDKVPKSLSSYEEAFEERESPPQQWVTRSSQDSRPAEPQKAIGNGTVNVNKRLSVASIGTVFRRHKTERRIVPVPQPTSLVATFTAPDSDKEENIEPPFPPPPSGDDVLPQPTAKHIENAAPPETEPAAPAEDALAGATAENPPPAHPGTWRRISTATQRMSLRGREAVREYFAPPDWVAKSPYQVRSLF